MAKSSFKNSCTFKMMMIRYLFFIFLLILGTPTLAEQLLSDKPWVDIELKAVILSNLLINGEMKIDDGKTLPSDDGYQVIRCWSTNHEDLPTAVVDRTSAVASLTPVVNSPFILKGKPIFYTLPDEVTSLEVKVRGKFENADVNAVLTKCMESCEEIRLPLKSIGSNQLSALVEADFADSYISKFYLNIKSGVKQISSVTLRPPGQPVVDTVARDRASTELCYNAEGTLTGFSGWHIAALLFMMIIMLMIIMNYIRRSDYAMTLLLSTFFVNSFLGVWGLYFGLSTYRLSQDVTDRDQIIKIAVVNFLCFCLFVLGAHLVSKLSLNKFKEVTRKVLARLDGFSWTWLYSALAFSILVFLVPKGYAYFRLMSTCDSGACVMQLVHIRETITSGFSFLKSHYQKLLFFHLTTVVSYILIAKLLLQKKSVFSIILIILLQITLLIYNGEKAPVMWYMAGLIFLFLSLKFKDRITTLIQSRIKTFFALTIILALPLFAVIVGSGFADRLVFGSLTVGYHLLNVFPEQMAFLNGRTMMNPAGIFGHEVFDLPFFLWRYIHPEIVYTATRGTSVTAFWGEAYANFGYLGAFIGALILGVIFKGLFLAVFVREQSIVGWGWGAWLLFRYTTFTESMFFSFVFDFYLFGTIFLIVMWLPFTKKSA